MSNAAQNVPWTSIVLAAVGVSSLVSTLVALAWQFVIWRWSGPRINPSLTPMYVFDTSGGPSTLALSVAAHNKGRGTCEVTQWYLDDGSDKNMVILRHMTGSAELPAKLEGLHSLTWTVPQVPVVEHLRDRKITRVRPVVIIGSGKRFRGDWVEVSTFAADVH